jgi:AmmeMemoRadiSam system protein A
VSYACVAFLAPGTWKGGRTVQPLDQLPHDRRLGEECRRKLLALARSTIRRYLSGERGEDLSSYVAPAELPPDSKLRAGAFVTLKREGRLRGCIGSIYPHQPLWEAVVGNAIHSAVHDRRFSAVEKSELDAIDIEVSVLTPPREVGGPEEFDVGAHGIIIEKEGRRAVFLPQVAPEQGWDREQTLSHLAVKAGLPSDAWREGTRFWVFEAQVFGEKEK